MTDASVKKPRAKRSLSARFLTTEAVKRTSEASGEEEQEDMEGRRGEWGISDGTLFGRKNATTPVHNNNNDNNDNSNNNTDNNNDFSSDLQEFNDDDESGEKETAVVVATLAPTEDYQGDSLASMAEHNNNNNNSTYYGLSASEEGGDSLSSVCDSGSELDSYGELLSPIASTTAIVITAPSAVAAVRTRSLTGNERELSEKYEDMAVARSRSQSWLEFASDEEVASLSGSMKGASSQSSLSSSMPGSAAAIFKRPHQRKSSLTREKEKDKEKKEKKKKEKEKLKNRFIKKTPSHETLGGTRTISPPLTQTFKPLRFEDEGMTPTAPLAIKKKLSADGISWGTSSYTSLERSDSTEDDLDHHNDNAGEELGTRQGATNGKVVRALSWTGGGPSPFMVEGKKKKKAVRKSSTPTPEDNNERERYSKEGDSSSMVPTIGIGRTLSGETNIEGKPESSKKLKKTRSREFKRMSIFFTPRNSHASTTSKAESGGSPIGGGSPVPSEEVESRSWVDYEDESMMMEFETTLKGIPEESSTTSTSTSSGTRKNSGGAGLRVATPTLERRNSRTRGLALSLLRGLTKSPDGSTTSEAQPSPNNLSWADYQDESQMMEFEQVLKGDAPAPTSPATPTRTKKKSSKKNDGLGNSGEGTERYIGSLSLALSDLSSPMRKALRPRRDSTVEPGLCVTPRGPYSLNLNMNATATPIQIVAQEFKRTKGIP